ncbi:DNA topoisomerase [Sulfurospirillum multivorans]|uniref:DNA topoisomerase n=2 Tax=Sulfurospirillum multivorans TaxID=66821 RepID=A0AA86ALT9_SULMK|nr:DNA topoisomerase [Sulfurospirillum multivorans]AHJ12991.1 putative topoisomerase IA [Sulfurospirillum multivorans DSM 12446]QEH06481.1 putative topoisomerase IA [Sulfurospirillum multivorans]
MQPNEKKYLVIVENQKKLMLYRDLLAPVSNVTCDSTYGYIVRIADNAKSGLGWTVNEKMKTTLDALKLKSTQYDEVFLAMDDISNGERLAWDISEYISHPKVFRITPRELTKESILQSIKNGARKIDQNLIDSYITRRIIEGIVSKNISEMMRWWFKKEGLITNENDLKDVGIGRVSALALGLIVQAEEKIDTFIPEYYKRVAVDYFHNNTQFSVKNKLKFTKDKKEELMAFMDKVKKERHVVHKFEKQTKDIVPPPPLNAAQLQKSAINQFQYSSKETMKIAKELYEGIEVDGRIISLITLPKTNSLFFSDETILQIIQLLQSTYGEPYTFSTKRVYKGADKNTTQEAIRPVSFEKEFFPKHVRQFLTEEQFKIYELIYQRTIATQMTSAIYDQSELVIFTEDGAAQFKETANKMIFDGWKFIGKHWCLDEFEEREEVILPDKLLPEEILNPLEIRAYEIKERSPWRYGEGRFITTLEKYNIADASFISEIQNFLEEKGTIKPINGMLYPLELGKKMYYFLQSFAPWLVDVDFGSKFEQDLKLIQAGEKSKSEVIDEYENLKNETIVKLGYKVNDAETEKWMLDKAKRIASQKRIALPVGIESNSEKLAEFINQHKETIPTLGKCPLCKEGEIYSMEHGYKCNVSTCSFMLWNTNVNRFFNNFKKKISDETMHKYIEIILEKGKCFIDNLYNPKKEKFFEAFITLKFNEQYQNWDISFESKSENQNDQSKEFEPRLTDGEREYAQEVNMHEENMILKAKLNDSERERRMITDEAKKDPLTRAYNRRCFDADIESFYRAKPRSKMSLAFIDGDKFKNVNDTYGHQAGDTVLQSIVNLLHDGIRDLRRTRVYRYGGEEFLILFLDEERKTILEKLNNIRQNIEKTPIIHEQHTINITISIGVSFLVFNDTIKAFIERADKAVYSAKEHGRNRIEIEHANVTVVEYKEEIPEEKIVQTTATEVFASAEDIEISKISMPVL